MAQTLKTEGLILKRWNFKERDKMVRILTPEHGKLSVRAISARKAGAKLAGHIEPFIHAQFFLAKSKTIDIIAGSMIIDAHMPLREDPLTSSMASYFSDIVDRLTDEGEADPQLFLFVYDFYQWLATRPPNALVLYAAIFDLYALLGYHFELYECYQCHKAVAPKGHDSENIKFLFELFAVECESCASPQETLNIAPHTLTLLRYFQAKTFRNAAKLNVTAEQWHALHIFFITFLQYHLVQPVRSQEVFYWMMNHSSDFSSSELGNTAVR